MILYVFHTGNILGGDDEGLALALVFRILLRIYELIVTVLGGFR